MNLRRRSLAAFSLPLALGASLLFHEKQAFA
jgi:hypothetical protein